MNDNSSLLHFNPPKDYPKDMLRNTYLKPKEVTYTSLRFAVETATGKLMSNTWSDKNVIAYCGTNCLNTAGIEMLIQHTKNTKALNLLTSKKDSLTGDESYVLKDSIINVSKYQPWHGSAFWNGKLELKQFVDALMHLIFLGVIKSTKKLISTWIQMSKRGKSFTLLARGLLTPIVEMGLDWCKIIEVESGWVSDNYLAFARLMKWYYHPLMVLPHDADAECKKLCSLNDINNCIGNLLSIISIVMIRGVDMKHTSDELNREIRIFLTYIHTISTSMDDYESKKKTYTILD